MNPKLIFLSVLLSLVTGLTTKIYAQVTIGSDKEPLKGSLLDLKSESDGTAKKGLLLPRVELKSKNSLVPLITATQEAEANAKQYHTGLVVYNLSKSSFLCPGLHTWSGSEWIQQGDSTVIPILQGDTESNSFIVPFKHGVDIPVKKAFDIWNNYNAPTIAKYGFNNTSGTAANVHVNLTTELAKSGYTAKAILLWMDKEGLVSNVNPANNTLQLIGTGDAAVIRVLPATGCESLAGNAVVAFAINNGSTDVIYWSWHIWFTDYDPNTATINGVGAFEATNGKVFRYNNTAASSGNYVFMDRFLGATSATPANSGSIGLHYQWGRKDPFPINRDFSGFIDENKDGTGNFLWGFYRTLPPAVVVPSTATGYNNLANAIKNPVLFYLSGSTGSTGTTDWYTNQVYSNLNGDRTVVQNDFLWDNGGKKTSFDPCPKGWRVPAYGNNQSPWFFQDANGATSPALYGAGASGGGTSAEFTADKGWQFISKPKYMLGYYPASGSRAATTGILGNVGTSGSVWSATPYFSNIKAYSFSFTSTSMISVYTTGGTDGYARSSGYSVRCVQE